MLMRVLLALALAAVAGIANARIAASQGLPSPCRARSADLATLEKRMARLERRIAKARPAADEAAPKKTLSKDQAALLEVLFQIHCLKVRQETDEAASGFQESKKPKTRGSKFHSAPRPSTPDQVPDADAQRSQITNTTNDGEIAVSSRRGRRHTRASNTNSKGNVITTHAPNTPRY